MILRVQKNVGGVINYIALRNDYGHTYTNSKSMAKAKKWRYLSYNSMLNLLIKSWSELEKKLSDKK